MSAKGSINGRRSPRTPLRSDAASNASKPSARTVSESNGGSARRGNTLVKIAAAISRCLTALVVYLLVVPVLYVLRISGLSRKLSSKMNGFTLRFNAKVAEKNYTRERTFGDYRPGYRDILVCSWIKSGTNWMLQVAYQVASKGEGHYEHIHDVVPWPEVRRFRRIDTQASIAAATGRRVIKTHLGIIAVPYSPDAKYITVIRDPKEVFVSSYHHLCGLAGPLRPSVDNLLELFLSRYYNMGFGSSWAEHTAGYWSWRERENVLVVLFKELKENRRAVTERIEKHLGIELSAEQRASVLEKSSFNFMREQDRKYHPDPHGFSPWSRHAKMIRRGVVGQTSELISVEQQQRIDRHCMEELASLGSDFPYERHFPIATPAALRIVS